MKPEYPDNWAETIKHMINHKNGFRASSFEYASEIAKSAGDYAIAEFLLNIAADCAVRDLAVWDHM